MERVCKFILEMLLLLQLFQRARTHLKIKQTWGGYVSTWSVYISLFSEMLLLLQLFQ